MTNTYPTRVMLVLNLGLFLSALALGAQAESAASSAEEVPANERPADASADATTTPPEEKRGSAPLDPALVGLPGLETTLVSAEDIDQATHLINARIAELEDAPRPDDGPSQNASEAQFDEQSAEEHRQAASDARTAAAPDARIEALRKLRLSLQRRAALIGRKQGLESARADLRQGREAFQQEGLAGEPPFSIATVDRLHGEHRVSEQAADAAVRAQAVAQRRLEAADEALAQSDQARRRLRDQLQRAENSENARDLARQLEVARLRSLAAYHGQQAARTDLASARRRTALARDRSDLLAAQIERVQADLLFTEATLQDELQALDQRAEEAQARIAALGRTSDQRESALFELQQRVTEPEGPTARDNRAARMAALEAELTAARKGIEYLSQIAAGTDSARTLWERRFALTQEGAQTNEALSSWREDSSALLETVDGDSNYARSEIAALRAQQLLLAGRLGESDLAPKLREALQRQQAALDRQLTLAEELLLFQERLGTLAERLNQELDPLVDRRSLAQRLDQLEEGLARWWNRELLVFQDQGIYLRDLIIGGVVFILVLAGVSFLKMLLRRVLLPHLLGRQGEERGAPRALALAVIRNTSLGFVVVVAFYAAIAASGLAPGRLQDWLWTLLVVVLWLQIGGWATAGALDLINRKRSERQREDPSAVTGFGLLLFFVRVGIWIVVLISILAHFNYPITGLIGALGVGGIAVAFAVQNILADVFSSMAIILDKPFRVGDFVITGNTMGVIERIGVKTTQVRSLSGEQVVLSNTDLLNSRIHNYKRMHERRVVFKLGVVYQTSPEQLERIPEAIEQIVRAQHRTRFDRAHFFEYGDFALIFEVVYYVRGADYNLYMDIQQAINLAIYRKFREQAVEFAYPTQELILRRDTPATASR